MTTYGNVAADQLERAQGAKGQNFFWGKEFVPESSGAGTLFESLFWLSKKLYEGPMLRLADSRKELWSHCGHCVGAGGVVVVASYFLFNHPDEMDTCWRELRQNLTVAADVWQQWPDTSVTGEHDCTMVLLFDPSSPLEGPLTTEEVLRTVQHFLGYCSRRRGKRHCWNEARSALIELVPEKKKEQWFASRQFLLSSVGQHSRCAGQPFSCEAE